MYIWVAALIYKHIVYNMGCECARLRKKEETEKADLKLSVKVQPNPNVSIRETPSIAASVQVQLNPIRQLSEPISAFYQLLPQVSSSQSLVPARFLSTGQPCVLRTWPKNKVIQGNFTRSTVAKELVRIHSLDHPNLLRPFELLEDHSNFYISYPVLSPLLSYLSHQPSLTEALIATIFAQLLSALSFAHSRQCLHKTIDLDCLYLRSSPTSTTIEICLGGFEKKIEGRRYHLSAFEAPETMVKEGDDKADVWSCGVILYHLLSGTSPFHPIKYTAMVSAGKTLHVVKPESNVSEGAWSLLQSMLEWCPEQRHSVAQCLLHPWVRQAFTPTLVSHKVVQNMLLAMKNDKPRSIFREAIKHYIVFRVEKGENLDCMTAMFKYLDSNADGKISQSELLAGLSKWMTQDKAEAKAQEIMATADRDSSGCIDYSEFLLSSLNEGALLSSSNLLAAFNSLDHDHSGKLSTRELKDVFFLCTSGDKAKVWRELMREVDRDGDGEIDFKEFMRMMNGK